MSERGFSFIEIAAALLILSISLIVLLDSQSRSLDLVRRAKSIDQATTLASSKMVELTEQVAEKGLVSLKDEERGEFDPELHEGFSWRYWTVKVPPPDFGALLGGAMGGEEEGGQAASNAALFAGPLQAIGRAWGDALRELHVEVIWKDGTREQSFEVVTHLIAADAIGQIQGAVGGLTGGR